MPKCKKCRKFDKYRVWVHPDSGDDFYQEFDTLEKAEVFTLSDVDDAGGFTESPMGVRKKGADELEYQMHSYEYSEGNQSKMSDITNMHAISNMVLWDDDSIRKLTTNTADFKVDESSNTGKAVIAAAKEEAKRRGL